MMTITPTKPASEPHTATRRIFFAQKHGGEQQCNQRCDEGKRDRLGQRQAPETEKEGQGDEGDNHAAQGMKPQRMRTGTRAGSGCPTRTRRKSRKNAAPQKHVVGAEDDDEALDRRVHCRKQENTQQADKNGQQGGCRVLRHASIQTARLQLD
jgi:hypothetical protein